MALLGLAEISTELLRRDRSPEQKRRLLMRPENSGGRGFQFKKTESLRGGVARAFELAGLSNSWTMLREAGLKHRNRVLVAEDPDLDVGTLAEALQVSRDEILKRRYLETSPGYRDYFGLQISNGYFETRIRQFSPTFLNEFGYHHATWELRFLPFCPVTYELLQSACSVCRPNRPHTQAWTRTLTPIECCDECGRCLGKQHACQVPHNLRPALEIIARIVSPDLDKRNTFIELLPTQLKANSAQQILDIVLSLTRHLATPNERKDEDEKLVRLHLACQALGQWPNGLDHLTFTASKKGAVLPQLYRDYAALGAEPPSATVQAAINWRCAMAVTEPSPIQSANIAIVGLTEASKLAGLHYTILTAVWDAGLVTKRYRYHGTKMLPAYEIKELLLFAAAWKRRVSAASVGHRFGLPAYGIEQCALINIMPAHTLALAADDYHFDPEVIEQFLQKLKDRSVNLSGDLIPLRRALRTISGGVKPWGLIIKALIDGAIPFVYNAKPDQNLSKCLHVAESDISKFLVHFAQKPALDSAGLSKLIPQRDALEILNCSGSSLGMLDGIVGQGINPKFFPLDMIIARAAQCIATIELAERLAIDPAAMHAILTNACIKQVVPGGWDRAQADNLVDRIISARNAQISLFASNSISIEVAGVRSCNRPAQSRKYAGGNNRPKLSAGSSVSAQATQQLSLKL